MQVLNAEIPTSLRVLQQATAAWLKVRRRACGRMPRVCAPARQHGAPRVLCAVCTAVRPPYQAASNESLPCHSRAPSCCPLPPSHTLTHSQPTPLSPAQRTTGARGHRRADRQHEPGALRVHDLPARRLWLHAHTGAGKQQAAPPVLHLLSAGSGCRCRQGRGGRLWISRAPTQLDSQPLPAASPPWLRTAEGGGHRQVVPLLPRHVQHLLGEGGASGAGH